MEIQSFAVSVRSVFNSFVIRISKMYEPTRAAVAVLGKRARHRHETILGAVRVAALHLRMATEVTEERRSADLIGTTRYQMRGPMYTMNQIGSHESTRKYQ